MGALRTVKRRQYITDEEQDRMKNMSLEELLRYIDEELIFPCRHKLLAMAMLKNKVYDFKSLIQANLYESQNEIILAGISKGFDMSKYYENYIYDTDQIKQIVEGLLAGVNVSLYDSNRYRSERMKFVKDALIYGDKELLRMHRNGISDEFMKKEWECRINNCPRPRTKILYEDNNNTCSNIPYTVEGILYELKFL